MDPLDTRLQKLILIALAEPRFGRMRRREFRRAIKRLWWGRDNTTTSSSLSRALRRLETRRCLAPSREGWVLLPEGLLLAREAWESDRERYLALSLSGPPLSHKQPEHHAHEQHDGGELEVELHFPDEEP